MRLPPPRPKPKFASWRFEHDLSLRATAQLVNAAAVSAGLVRPGVAICSHEQVRTLCLPFGHPCRSRPRRLVRQAIEALTDGEVASADWSAPVAVAA